MKLNAYQQRILRERDEREAREDLAEQKRLLREELQAKHGEQRNAY